MFGSPLGFSVLHFTASFDDNDPVNAEILYELINRDRDDKHKTGNVIAWSRIEE